MEEHGERTVLPESRSRATSSISPATCSEMTPTCGGRGLTHPWPRPKGGSSTREK